MVPVVLLHPSYSPFHLPVACDNSMSSSHITLDHKLRVRNFSRLPFRFPLKESTVHLCIFLSRPSVTCRGNRFREPKLLFLVLRLYSNYSTDSNKNVNLYFYSKVRKIVDHIISQIKVGKKWWNFFFYKVYQYKIFFHQNKETNKKQKRAPTPPMILIFHDFEGLHSITKL